MSMEDDIRKDREAGSGPNWRWTHKDPITGLACTKYKFCDLGGWYSFLRAPCFTVATDDGEKDNHAEAEANMRRIARLPDLETAYLAQSETLADLQKRADALAEALRGMVGATCGPDGFAACVRADTGLPYPWPALEDAETGARAALAAYEEGKR